jgi:hypothetical protein
MLVHHPHRIRSPHILEMIFICISGEKKLRTIWTDLEEDEFPEVFNR